MSQKQKKTTRKGASAPKKVWRKKADSARELAAREGQRGVDSRSQAVSAIPLQASFVSEVTDVAVDSVATYDTTSISSLALGVVLNGIKKGWLNQTNDVGTASSLGYPYYAYVKLYQSFTSAMLGTVPTLQNAPRWYWHIVQALNPKTLNYKTGRVNLKWNVDVGAANVVPDLIFPYLGGNAVLGIAQFGAPTVNGFIPVIGPGPYTADLGDAAINSLFTFYKAEGMTQMCPTFETPCTKTGSAFAVCGAELGNSSGNGGGVISTIYSETAIHMPVLAKLAQYQPTGSFYRGWQRIQVSGGSPCYTIPRLMEFTSESQLYNQLCPQFKYYNFDEFFEVLSLTIGTALEIANQTQIGAPPPPCPLTVFQVKALLRNTLMRRFFNHMAQDLVFNGPDLFNLAPFSAAVNGSSTTTTNMLLPLFLAENIRACGRKQIHLGSKQHSVIDYVPILARPADLPEPGNYNYNTATGTALVYEVDPTEVPINIIDLSWNNGGTTAYITTEGEHLLAICGVWNDWVKNLSSYLINLVDPGLEGGIDALSTVFTTLQQRYIAPQPVPPEVANAKILKQVSKKKIFGTDPEEFKKKHLKVSPVSVAPGAGDYFANLYPTQLTTTNQPLEPLMKYTKVMIAPAAISTGAQPVDAATPAAQQIFRIEPYRIPMSSLPSVSGADSAGTQTALSRHLQMAQLDVKSSLAANSEVQMDLEEAAKRGRGGFFSNLAGMFAEDVIGIKGGRAIAGAVGNALGI